MTVPEYPPRNPPGVPGGQTRLTPPATGEAKSVDLKFPGIEPRTAHSRSERLTTRPAGDRSKGGQGRGEYEAGLTTQQSKVEGRGASSEGAGPGET